MRKLLFYSNSERSFLSVSKHSCKTFGDVLVLALVWVLGRPFDAVHPSSGLQVIAPGHAL